MAKKNPILLVTTREALRLPHRLRVAWVATVTERVCRLYSPEARQHFGHNAAIDFAWAFALGNNLREEAPAQLQRLADTLKRVRMRGYNSRFRRMGIALLNEVADDNGLGGPVAVVSAACGFAAWQLYRQGVGEDEPLLPAGYLDSLVKQGLRFGRAVFEAAGRGRRKRVSREMFAAVPLDLSLVRLPADTVARATRKPPSCEAEAASAGERGT